MPSHLSETHSCRWRYLVFFSIAAFVGVSTSVGHVIPDSHYLYHEGEYLGLLGRMASYYRGEVSFPLIIHGAMDYTPSQIARLVYGDDRVIVGTRLVNSLIVVGCWTLFLEICWRLAGERFENKVVAALAAAMVLIAISPPLHSTALALQQSFIGVRDVFILLTLFFCVCHRDSKRPLARFLFLSMASLSTIAAFFWSYDRGIMSAAFMLAILAGLGFQRRYADLALAIFSLAAAALCLDYLKVFGSLSENASNILYWLRYSSELYGLAVSDLSLRLMLLFLLLYVGATLLGIVRLGRNIDADSRFLVIGLVLIQIALLKSLMNRPDMPRLSWGVWPAVLLMSILVGSMPLALAGSSWPVPRFGLPNASLAARIYALVIAGFILTMSPTVGLISHAMFAKDLVRPKHDVDLVSAEVREIAQLLAQRNDGCVFNWINEGVFALLSHKRFCTDYQYAMYASRDREQDLLRQLKRENPSVVIFDVAGMSMMNDRSMAARLPLVHEYIKRAYPNAKVIGRYQLVYR